VFSGVPLTITVDGAARGSSEDGQLMLSPGTYNVELASERFNFRETRSIKIEPGQVASYSVTLPVTPLHVDAPDGVEVSIDGQPAGVTPLGDVSVQVGTHEITGRGTNTGERRKSIEAKVGEPAEASLK
jgi:hypothetical protein